MLTNLKRAITSTCYDMQQVCTYLQPSITL